MVQRSQIEIETETEKKEPPLKLNEKQQLVIMDPVHKLIIQMLQDADDLERLAEVLQKINKAVLEDIKRNE